MTSEDKTGQVDLIRTLTILKLNIRIFVYCFLAGILLSFVTIFFSRIEYESVSVIGLKKNSQAAGGSFMNGLNNSNAFNALAFMGGSESSKSDLPAEILGETFLNELIKDEDFEKEILAKGICKFGKPGLLTLDGFLNWLEMYGSNTVASGQRYNNLLSCIRSMIDIKKFKYNKLSSDAFEVTARYNDPLIASFLANKVVEKFFIYQDKKSKEDRDKILRYLSQRLNKALEEKKISASRLEAYISRNVSNFSPTIINPETDTEVDLNVYIAKEAAKLVLSVSELANRKVELSAIITKLDNNLQKRNFFQVFKTFPENFYFNISDNFFKKLNEIEASEVNEKERTVLVEKFYKTELSALRKSLANLENSIIRQDKKLGKVLKAQEDLTTLTLDYEAKTGYYIGLQGTVLSKTVDSGLEALRQNKLYSEATPQLFPVTPNVKIIFVVWFLSSLFIGIFIIFVKNVRRIYIYKAEDLKEFAAETAIASVSRTSILSLNKAKNKIGETLSAEFGFLLNNLTNKKTFLVLNPGERDTHSTNMTTTIVRCIEMFLKDRGLSVNLNSYGKLKLPFFKRQKIEHISKVNLTDLSGVVSRASNENGHIMIFSNSDNYSENCQLISTVDAFALVVVAGRCHVEQLSKFFNNIDVEKEKCAGIVLLD